MKKTVRRITWDERLFIETQLKKGTVVTDIARMLGRRTNVIYYQILNNGGYENYSAAVSHEKYLEGKKNVGRKPKGAYKNLSVEVESLKLVIEILVEEIKKLKEKL